MQSGQALTLDGGKSWHQLPNDFSFLVHSIAVYQDAIYLAGHELVVSHDQGTLITEYNTGSNFPAEPDGVWIDPVSGKILIVTATVVSTTLWQSTDQGKTWKVLGKSFAGSYYTFAHTLPSGAWAICLIAGDLGCSSDGAAHWTWAVFPKPMTSLYGAVDDKGNFVGVSDELVASIYRLDVHTGKWTNLAMMVIRFHGSCASPVLVSSSRQNSLTQQMKTSSTIHRTFDEFEAIDVSLHRSVTVRKKQRSFDSSVITL